MKQATVLTRGVSSKRTIIQKYDRNNESNYYDTSRFHQNLTDNNR